MSDEAHFPAEQPRPRTAPRLPPSQRDSGRPQGSGEPPRPRSQEAFRLATLSKRADFLAANRGKRAPMPGFVLLVRPRGDDDQLVRVGFTVTKKIGNAVVRNRMKRRFRALVRDIFPDFAISGADHVLIGRSSGIERDYASLSAELKRALAKVAK
jgi:ribonuclease P protein component